MHEIDISNIKFLPDDKIIFFTEKECLVKEGGSDPELLCLNINFHEVPVTSPIFVLSDFHHGSLIYCAKISKENLPRGYTLANMRSLFVNTDLTAASTLIRVKHLLHWQIATRYCGYCSGKLRPDERLVMKKCDTCREEIYPYFSPAVLVCVQKDDQILLARSPHFPPGQYSVLAGFVEPGESAEMAATREVKEETGITITQPQYFGSQPWPFPHNLMIGFEAHYVSGSLILQEDEIEDAQWFSANNLPPLPHKASISRQLIDAFVRRVTQT